MQEFSLSQSQQSAQSLGRATDKTTEQNDFAQAFACHRSRLLRLIAGMGLSCQSADMLQEVYLAALKKPGRWQNQKQLSMWLTQVTINSCMQEFRRRKQFSRSAEQICEKYQRQNAGPATPAQKAITAEHLTIIMQALRDMDEQFQVPLMLKYFNHMDSKQIGEVMQLKHVTVRSRLRKGRMILAQKLTEKGVSL